MQVVGTRQTLFQSTRLSRASTPQKSILFFNTAISIHKALASLDSKSNTNVAMMGISIHKALASLDSFRTRCRNSLYDFNPQGSREPRLCCCGPGSHRRSDFNPQGSREPRQSWLLSVISSVNFNPQGSREPRRQKCTIILASMPHLHASYYTSSTNRLSS